MLVTENETPLERAIRETPDIEERPDLILRLVDLLFFDHPKEEKPS